jgi:hypothetical protein
MIVLDLLAALDSAILFNPSNLLLTSFLPYMKNIRRKFDQRWDGMVERRAF